MALAFVREGGSNGNKTLTQVSWTIAAPAAGHAAGNVLVIASSYFPSASTFNVTSVTDARGNTYVVLEPGILYAGSNSGVATAIAISRLTTALVSGDLITITTNAISGPSRWATVSAEFSGGTSTKDGSSSSTNSSDILNSGTPTGTITPPNATDLVIGAVGFANNTAMAITEDTDNAGGDTWHSLTVAGTTGGSAPSNFAIRMAYKFTTSSAAQQYGPSLTSQNCYNGCSIAAAKSLVAAKSLLPGMAKPQQARQLARWY